MVILQNISRKNDPGMCNETTRNSKNMSTILGQTLGKFSKQTSISGISNAGIANSNFRRGCWLLIFAVFGYFTLYGFQDVVHDYLEYPVTTSIHIEHRNQVIED